jgi:molecular chaperone HscB
VNLGGNDFELFGLDRRFALDRAALDARYLALQAQAHPDRHAAAGAAAQRVALQWATRINQAYGRLKDPLSRAALLCELAGAPIAAESNTAMPRDFLVQQMQWREALEEAASPAQVQALMDAVMAAERVRLGRVHQLLDEPGDHTAGAQAAAEEVRALMFLRRFGQDIESRLDALEGAH